METSKTAKLNSRITQFVQNSPARMAVIIAAVLFAATIIVRPSALNMSAIGSIILLTALLSIASAGQTIVLIGGGIDMSVGAVMSTAAIITSYVMDGVDGRVPLVMAVALGMGALVGLVNGVSTVAIGLPPMIITMAISNVMTRLQYVVTQGSPSGYVTKGFASTIIGRTFGVVPNIVWWCAIIFPIVFFLLNRSRFGKQVYMVGNNPTAAKLTGVRVNRIIILTYVFSGLLAALAGVIGAGYTGTGRSQVFDDYAFTSLVAVIVGGTSLSGGVGSFAGSIAGSLLMVVLSNFLTTMSLSQPVRNLVNGVLLILLLMLYNRSKAVRQ